MTTFAYRDGALFAEDVDLAAVAAQVGTPAYVYSTAALVANYRAYVDALPGCRSRSASPPRPTPISRCCAPWWPRAPESTWSRPAR
jgi:diaminopimelate decarboxylase